jgi:hypothetical protein
MQTLAGCPIIGPAEQALWPEPDAPHWHQQKIFRKYRSSGREVYQKEKGINKAKETADW